MIMERSRGFSNSTIKGSAVYFRINYERFEMKRFRNMQVQMNANFEI